MVFSLEFKNGKNIFTAQDAQQAEDYAIDIKNFHKESENLYVCPILIATDAEKLSKPQSCDCYPDKQVHLQRENIETLVPKINKISSSVFFVNSFYEAKNVNKKISKNIRQRNRICQSFFLGKDFFLIFQNY